MSNFQVLDALKLDKLSELLPGIMDTQEHSNSSRGYHTILSDRAISKSRFHCPNCDYHHDGEARGGADVQQSLQQLQFQVDMLRLRYTETQRNGLEDGYNPYHARHAADDGTQYRHTNITQQANTDLQEKLDLEQRKTHKLQHEVSRLRGMIDGLLDTGIRLQREERNASRPRGLRIYIKRKSLRNIYKRLTRWVKDKRPFRPIEDFHPLMDDDIELHTLDNSSLVISQNDTRAEPILSYPVDIGQSDGIIRRTRSRLESASFKRRTSNASKAAVPELDYIPAPSLPVPDLNPSWTPRSVASVIVSIATEDERQHSILTAYLKQRIFSDSIKRECILDIAMSWQTKLHQAPKCLYTAYRGKIGGWSARERREGGICNNCKNGIWWPEGEIKQCIRLNSRQEIEILNPQPWDFEKQEIYDRANRARKAGASKEEVKAIEREARGLGKGMNVDFGLQIT